MLVEPITYKCFHILFISRIWARTYTRTILQATKIVLSWKSEAPIVFVKDTNFPWLVISKSPRIETCKLTLRHKALGWDYGFLQLLMGLPNYLYSYHDHLNHPYWSLHWQGLWYSTYFKVWNFAPAFIWWNPLDLLVHLIRYSIQGLYRRVWYYLISLKFQKYNAK